MVMISNYKKFNLGETISNDQRNFFNEYGFIHFQNFITPEAVDSVVKASAEVQRKWIANDVKKINGVPIKYGIDVDGQPIVQRFAFINQHHPVLSEFLHDPRFNILLDL